MFVTALLAVDGRGFMKIIVHYYRGDHKMQAAAIEKFIEQPYAYGLDREHGGLFYFLDVGGHSPMQLEWGMKLWWVHCEAMVASLLAYQHTREPRHWQMFHEICQYTLSKVLGRPHTFPGLLSFFYSIYSFM